ncbi:MAG: JAB domain-containing protein [Bacteroidales bacterium]
MEFTHFLEQYQTPKQSAFTQYNVTSSEITNTIAKEIFKECIDFRKMFVCLYLNKANKVLGYYVIGLGGVALASVDLKLIFSVALNMSLLRALFYFITIPPVIHKQAPKIYF